MSQSIVIRENIPEYMKELKAWLKEIQEEPLEQMAAFFQARIADYEDHMSLWKQAYVRLAEMIPPEAQTLLDLGCGTGLELDEILARRTLSVTGIDLCPEMLEKLREKHPAVGTVCEDYFQAELGEGCFDCVVSFESLHHFKPEKKRGLYEKIHRALKPGGVFLLVDYLACCQEEETLLMDFCWEQRRKQGIPEDVFIHFDTPLTVEHETALLWKAGFSKVELVDCIEGASLLRCEKGSGASHFENGMI